MVKALGMVSVAALVCTLAPDAVAAPLVADARGAQPQVLRVKAEADDAPPPGLTDYLKEAATFAGGDVVDEVKDGRVMEHILGGLLAAFGGHIWAPRVTYKEAPEVPGAMTIGIISTVMAWLPIGILPFMVFWFVPYVGWTVGSVLLVLVGIPWIIYNVINVVCQYWVFPRALQLMYSDAYDGDGGGSSKKRSSDDDDAPVKKSKPQKKTTSDDDED